MLILTIKRTNVTQETNKDIVCVCMHHVLTCSKRKSLLFVARTKVFVHGFEMFEPELGRGGDLAG